MKQPLHSVQAAEKVAIKNKNLHRYVTCSHPLTQQTLSRLNEVEIYLYVHYKNNLLNTSNYLHNIAIYHKTQWMYLAWVVDEPRKLFLLC